MELSALSLIPPAITLILAFKTRNVIIALLAGITSAALMTTNFAPFAAFKATGKYVLEVIEIKNFLSWEKFTTSENLFVFGFLLLLGMIMAMMERSGDAFAYAEFLKKRLKNKKSAEQASLMFSLSLFVDDYLSAITTSSVMTVVTDAFKVPRIKAAYLVTSLAAPLCTLIPISIFGPPMTRFIENGGISAHNHSAPIIYDAFAALIKAIPFIFQSSLMVLGAWFIIRMGISYGIIGEHEKIAENSGNLYGNRAKPKSEAATERYNSHSLFSFLAPLAVLFISIIVMALYTGNYWLMGGTNSLTNSLSNANMYISLVVSGLFALTFSTTLHLINKHVTGKQLLSTWWSGIKEMGPSIVVLILAWSFAEFLKGDLHTGEYIAQSLLPVLRFELLPAVLFLLGTIISFSLGSSWATMAIIFPIAIPMIPTLYGISTPAQINLLPITFPVIGAIISGAIMGSSMSPISDLLVITTNNTGTKHFNFIKAQVQYLTPLGIGSLVGYIIAGFSSHLGYSTNIALSLGTALFTAFGLLLILNSVYKEKAKS